MYEEWCVYVEWCIHIEGGGRGGIGLVSHSQTATLLQLCLYKNGLGASSKFLLPSRKLGPTIVNGPFISFIRTGGGPNSSYFSNCSEVSDLQLASLHAIACNYNYTAHLLISPGQ